ncbi:MAG: nucleoside-triphosphatase [Candidatus Pacearchaeota archaeon]
MKAIFITGLPGCGKTTLIKKLLEESTKAGKKYLAIISEEIRERGKRKGFDFKLIDSGKLITKTILALNKKIAEPGKPSIKFGKYFVFPQNVDEIVDKASELIMDKQIIFIDEIGRMEFYSEKFRGFVAQVAKMSDKIMSDKMLSDKMLVASLHRAFVNEFKTRGEIFWLSRENFEIVLEKIKKMLEIA